MARVSRNASIPYQFAIILIDTSKILFLLIQYLKGIKWSFGICAISSALQKSNISAEQPSVSMSLSRPCRGRSRIWRGRWDSTVRTRDAIDKTPRSSQLAGRERKPGNEADTVGGATGEHILAGAVDQVVAVLHRRHRKYLSGGLDVGHRDLAQSRMADDAVVQQLTHGAELFVARHARIDPMKLPEIDLLDTELPETALGLRNQIGGASVRRPLIRPPDA
jgi:hypothetical protein